MKENDYFSEEELEKLIMDVEEETLINAPPDFLGNILTSIDGTEKKKTEFRKYCFKVISSMAAAIAFLILIPGISGIKESEIPSKESIISESIQTREEVTGNSGKRIIGAMNESHVFGDMWKFNFFQ